MRRVSLTLAAGEPCARGDIRCAPYHRAIPTRIPRAHIRQEIAALANNAASKSELHEASATNPKNSIESAYLCYKERE